MIRGATAASRRGGQPRTRPLRGRHRDRAPLLAGITDLSLSQEQTAGVADRSSLDPQGGRVSLYLGPTVLVEHQGTLPGFHSQIYLAPDDGIGQWFRCAVPGACVGTSRPQWRHRNVVGPRCAAPRRWSRDIRRPPRTGTTDEHAVARRVSRRSGVQRSSGPGARRNDHNVRGHPSPPSSRINRTRHASWTLARRRAREQGRMDDARPSGRFGRACYPV